MPSMYRSKSVRRFDEANSRLTDFIERDKQKVLAAASVQLFISTPQLDKWFKSSTGTICFLRDTARKSCFYFRLFSLMQGQLWEQEMTSPFSYKKLSPAFHYLAANRFNYGFKFICEDEAERFFNVIVKFCAEQHSDEKNDTTNLTPSLDENTSNIRVKLTQSHITTTIQQDSLTTTNLSAIANIANGNGGILSSHASRATKRNTVSANRSLSGVAGQITPQGQTSSSFVTSMGTSFTKTSIYLNDSSTTLNRSRPPTHSSERRSRRIDKSEISCPFRCSCIDLDETSNQLQNNLSVLKDASSTINNSNETQGTQNETPGFIQKYSAIVQRALSTNVTPNSTNRIYQSTSKTRILDDDSAAMNADANTSALPPCKNPALASLATSKLMASTPDLKNQVVNSSVSLPSSSNCQANKKPVQQKCSETEREMEIIREIMATYNIPINLNLIKALKGYIKQFGTIEEFQVRMQSEEERAKLITFVAESSEAFPGKSVKSQPGSSENLSRSGTSLNQTGIHAGSNSPRLSQKKISNNQMKMISAVPTPPSSPRKSSAKYQNTYAVVNPSVSPPTPKTPSTESSHSKSRQNCSLPPPPPPLPPSMLPPPSERTPIRNSNLLSMSAITHRQQTPSPSGSTSLLNRSGLGPEQNAPPKPPRRSSLKHVA